MTVSSETYRSGPYSGNGITTAFDYDFKIADEAHLKVIVTTLGAEVVADPSDYTVTGVGLAGGGQAIFTVAPATGVLVTMVPDVPFLQELDLQNQGAFFAENIESALDLCVMRDNQLREALDRCLKLPSSADPDGLDDLLANIAAALPYADEITAVAGQLPAVVTAAANIVNIQNAPANAAAAAASASAASGSATAASGSATAASGSASAAAASAAAAAISAAAMAVGFANGLTIRNDVTVPNARMVITTTGRSLLENTSGAGISIAPQSLTINAATNGVNGLDTGSLAASTWYHEWIISNGTTVAGLMSLSDTAPTMPGGYTYKLRVGSIRTNASSQFWRKNQRGSRAALRVASGTTLTTYPSMIAGNSGNPATFTWTAVAVANFVTPTAKEISGILTATQSTGATAVVASPNDGHGSAPYPACSVSGGDANNLYMPFTFALESANIYYASSNGGASSMACTGWTDTVNAS